MRSNQADADLERRFRDALQEVMPQLAASEQPVSQAPNQRDDLGDQTQATSPVDRDLATIRVQRRGTTAGRKPHWALSAAATLLVIVGGFLAFAFGRGRDDPAPVATAAPTTIAPAQSDQVQGSLLSMPVPAGARPTMAVDRENWTMEGYASPRLVPTTVPSATCAGCGASRLIIAADGPLLSGAVFTAWSINDTYQIDEFDWPVTIGAEEGRFIGSQDGSVPASQNRVRVVWPIGSGRTAFVDAYGLTNDQVFEMAATLTFDSSLPVMADLPAGLSIVSTPAGASVTEQIYHRFIGGPIDAELSGESVPVIELIVTNGGLQGLLDWRNPGGLFGGWGQPVSINGATVLIDADDAASEPPILAISATWSVGDWNYTAIGHVFQTEAEFFDVVAGLRMTDEATFMRATSKANTYELGTLTPSIDGTTGILDEVS